jgi:flagellar biosynthesis chaperone FliJ
MADPIARLLRLRAAQADAARRDLAIALRAREAAGAQTASAQHAVSREAKGAPRDPMHPLAGAYTTWLPSGQAAIARARVEEQALAVAAEQSRAALAQARMAVKACESLAEARAEVRRLEGLRREQVTLEDAARKG